MKANPDVHVPEISQELVKTLEALFPDRSPDIETPDREIWVHHGKVLMVRYLREQHRRQTEPME